LGEAQNQGFTFEQHAKQLTCELSTPTDSKRTALLLTFDEASLTWEAPLKDIVDLETYNLSLQCTRKRTRMMKNGLEITLAAPLYIEVIDLVDGKRFLQDMSSFRSTNENTFLQPPVDAPTGLTLPATPTLYTRFEATTIVQNVYNKDTRKAVEDRLKATVVTDFPKAKDTSDTEIYKDYTFAAVAAAAVASFDTDYVYFNASGAELVNNYLYNIAQHPWIPFRDFSSYPESYSRIAQPQTPWKVGNSGAFQTTSEIWMTVANSDFEFPTNFPIAFAADYFLWGSQLKTVLYSDYLYSFNSWVRSNQQDNFWGSATTKCGYNDGTVMVLKSGFEATATEFEWGNYEVRSNRFLCGLGEACTMNADCASNPAVYTVCKASVCTALPLTEPKYVSISYDTGDSWKPYSIKQYFNTSPQVSVVVAIAAVVIAAFVF
jgi:hypothetical protein